MSVSFVPSIVCVMGSPTGLPQGHCQGTRVICCGPIGREETNDLWKAG